MKRIRAKEYRTILEAGEAGFGVNMGFPALRSLREDSELGLGCSAQDTKVSIAN